MARLSEEISSCKVPPASVRVWWLGGAGFVFKSHANEVVFIDPCLSDAVERLHGFKRMMPSPIMAEDVACDLVINTHEHTDHLDPDALPVIARNNPSCTFAGSAGCVEPYGRLGIRPERIVHMEANRSFTVDGVTIHTASADHGDYAPSALVVVIELDGLRILHSGDTSLRADTFKPLYELEPDILLPCINGNFGNMNHIDAAMMAKQVQPQMVIPCHFWMFVEHGGDPAGFLYACRHFCPEVPVTILRPGEGVTCQRRA